MLINRQKCILYLLQELQKCNKIQLAKLLFLIEKESKTPNLCPFYSFLPYKYGPYSFEIFHDIDNFEKENYVSQTNTTISFENKKIIISPALKYSISHIISKYGSMNNKNLINYVYQNYPEYTIFSEIDKQQEYNKDQTGIYTIGYQGKSIDKFLHNLIKEKIHILVDIRYNPWSMKYGFTKNILKSLCGRIKIDYCHIPELGIPGSMRQQLVSKKDYDELFKKYKIHLKNQQKQIDKLNKQAKTKRLALMCFEEDPNFCHRHVLAKHLQNNESQVTIT